MKPTFNGMGLGKAVLSPAGGIAMLVLLATAVTLAAPPAKTHPPKVEPSASASVIVEDTESPEAEDSDAPETGAGACNALHGNAPAVIAELVANWPTKHAKGGVPKDLPPGLQKVAERLAACPPLAEEPGASASPDDSPTPQPSTSPIVVDDEDTVLATGKKVDKTNSGRKP